VKKVLSFLGAKGLISFFILFFVFIFCIQNSEPISIRFFFWDLVQIPKLYLVLVSIFLGALLGGLMTWKILSHKSKDEQSFS